MKRPALTALFILNLVVASAQDTTKIKAVSLSLAQYEKAKAFSITDLNNDTYVKFDNNTYVLDRYEMRKPYIITGDDGLRKRIDIYKLLLKDGMAELGTVIYYTNERGKVYTVVQPGFTAGQEVWNQYFNDIDNINKEEKNFVLKLSYVLSKEMSFQLYKALNLGKDMSAEMATYGTYICFPGGQQISMANGSVKNLEEIKPGDHVITVDPATKKPTSATVTRLVQHQAKNYAITKLLVMEATERTTVKGSEVHLSEIVLSATPNHPIETTTHTTTIGQIEIGDHILCLDANTHTYKAYTVYDKTETAGGIQKVYNMETATGTTFVVNGVLVKQK